MSWPDLNTHLPWEVGITRAQLDELVPVLLDASTCFAVVAEGGTYKLRLTDRGRVVIEDHQAEAPHGG